MDQETIQRINREALKMAKEHEQSQQSIYVYLISALGTVILFFIMRYYQPDFLKSKDDQGQLTLDQTKVVLASIAGGLVVYLGYQYFY